MGTTLIRNFVSRISFSFIQELTQQIGEIQKKADTLQAELMQEKMSHVNTRDELEGLHKQLSIVKEEAAHEKEEAEAAMASNKATQEAEKHALNDEIKTLKDRAEALEAERLSNMPPDTAKEIKELQDKLVSSLPKHAYSNILKILLPKK